MMILALPQDLQASVRKSDLLELEETVLHELDFNVQQVGPMAFAERYLQVMGLDSSPLSPFVLKTCDEICEYLTRRSHIYLTHPMATVGAASLILALSVCLNEKLSKTLKAAYLPEFRKKIPNGELLDCWSPEVVEITQI